MNQSKKIEVSKSTFISLKAELLRKQDEVNKAKRASKNQIENFVPSSKFGKDKDDTKPSTSQSKPTPPDAEESEALRKSKEKLEKKALLYDHLSQASSSSKDQSEEYLVNFDKKSKEESTGNVSSAPADDTIDGDDSDEEWVDYVDCLGRTRRCYKTDLEHTQKQDESLKIKLSGPPPVIQETVVEKSFVKEGDNPERELQAPDAYKEQLRKQWEQKEEEIMMKDKVHYEDVLFNEARAHGVGYYALSGDASERARQQASLTAARAETERAREAAAQARGQREEVLQARLRAARARQRARAGLPPEEAPDPKSAVTAMLLDFVEEQKRASSEKVAEEARTQREAKEVIAKKEREKMIREWDLGKEDQELPRNKHVELTQEQWVDRKRKERPDEFAPPESVTSKQKTSDSREFDNKGFFCDTGGDRNLQNKNLTWKDVRKQTEETPSSSYSDQSDRALFFTTKKSSIEAIKNKYFDPSVNITSETLFKAVPIRNECSDEDDDSNVGKVEETKKTARTGVEIEPPSTYEYFGPTDKKGKKDGKKINVNEAFEKGVKYLENQAASKDKRKNKAFLDDM